MKTIFLFVVLALPLLSFADSEQGCSIRGILQEVEKSTLVKNTKEDNCHKVLKEEHTIAITKELMSVKVLHEKKELIIERKNSELTCPPFCIEPMNIKNVVTVGELEILDFIEKAKEKKARLLIDVRENNFYVEGTIPSAINVPFSMLDDGSRYQKEVLKLLAGEVIKNDKWSFPNAQTLLLFGESSISSEASRSVKKLLALGYPSSKLLYYRGGISAWRALGLTFYKDYSK